MSAGARPPVGGTGGLEKSALTLGMVALTDCAPLVVALEKGFFARHGLTVHLSCEASWATIRDKVALGALDGAQMLAGMPLAATLDIGGAQPDIVTAFSMDLNGNAITVSNALYARMCAADAAAMRSPATTAHALRRVIDADRAAGRPTMTFAMVFPVSTHNYQLRYWMAAAGIDPQRDVRLVVIPPAHMVANLEAGTIDGYCVGEPWNQRAVEWGVGRVLTTGYELWNNAPEKVFGVTRAWAEAHPTTHRAVVAALIEAARWLDAAENRAEVVDMIAAKHYVNAPPAVVGQSMNGTWRYARDTAPVAMPDFNVFYRYAATFPWRSHAVWLLTQMVRWGQLDPAVDYRRVAESVYRCEVYRAAAAALGIATPDEDYKAEGAHDGAWTLASASGPMAMGADRFFDGMRFDPARPAEYLAGFAVHAMGAAAFR